MTTPTYLNAIYRDSDWWIGSESQPILLADGQPLPIPWDFLTDGVSRQKPEVLLDYQIDLAMEAEQIIRGILAMMVDFHQVQKLAHFLLGFCDCLEFSIYKTVDKVEDCQFQIGFSNGVSLEFSTQACGFTLWWLFKPRTFHVVNTNAIEAFLDIAHEVWLSIQNLPIWEVTADSKRRITYRRRAPNWENRENSASQEISSAPVG